jgi:hypothetical protein
MNLKRLFMLDGNGLQIGTRPHFTLNSDTKIQI